MFLCQHLNIDTMFSRISDALQTAADVIAPPPTPLQDFEYHWKQVKSFYCVEDELPKVHINKTNLPHHLEGMLQIIIKAEDNSKPDNRLNECLEYLIVNRPLDLLAQLSVTDTPPGIRICVLNWIRRLLSCVESAPLDNPSLLQPVQTLITLCNGIHPSPYEQEEILFLETVAGLVRKNSALINLFLPSHKYSVRIETSKKYRSKKQPVKNSLFECSKIEANIRRIEILPDSCDKSLSNNPNEDSSEDNCDIGSSSSQQSDNAVSNDRINRCDCEDGERFALMDAILSYMESPIAPPPTPLQDFEYHWKQVKSFYCVEDELPKVHINKTNLPHHLEGMLQIIIKAEDNSKPDNRLNECLEYLIVNRPLDLLAQLSVTDTPPGIRICVLNWIRRLLSCVESAPLDNPSLLQPVQTLITLCNGIHPSPYEQEEILFLETVAGLVRKNSALINLFLPSHKYSVRIETSKKYRSKKQPVKNSLFECSKIEANIRRIEILPDSCDKSLSNNPNEDSSEDNCDIGSSSSQQSDNAVSNDRINRCDCEDGERFALMDAILSYMESPIAPPPTPLQDFEYHWKQVKSFYCVEDELPKVHINKTNLPHHLEGMLQIIIKAEDNSKPDNRLNECLEYLIVNRPLDLLAQLSVTDTPPGIRICVLNWIRRLLSCVESAPLDNPSLLQPVQTLITLCNGIHPSPYEQEEILFLETVAGLVRKNSALINLFLPSHKYSVRIETSKKYRSKKQPVKNSLFECSKIEANIRRIEILPDSCDKSLSNNPNEDSSEDNCDIGSSSSQQSDNAVSNDRINRCDCEDGERFALMDAILSYMESPDSQIVVRACEAALIIASAPTIDLNCTSVKISLDEYTSYLIEKLIRLCDRIPEDIDPGDIEESNISWGLIPRDSEYNHFVGRAQLHEFLCWLDYANCVGRECMQLTNLGYKFRNDFLLGTIEPVLISIDIPFMLALLSKVIKQINSFVLMEEIANWLVGDATQTDSSGRGDCLLNIVIENAQDNSDVMLAALQFIEALLDNPHERILHEILFRYVNTRGYYDSSTSIVQTWSDEEDERERRRGSADGPIKSRTLAPHNILKVINNFLLLLPRQIMIEAAGTCYEEYVQDASRHYKLWIKKTANFSWPIEALSVEKDDSSGKSVSPSSSLGLQRSSGVGGGSLSQNQDEMGETRCNDSGISEESFYEGPLLKMLFNHVRNMAFQPCEINLAVIAILSKLAFLPHPYLHEILLNPEIPVVHGAATLWTSMQVLARQLLLEIPKLENFQKKIGEAGKRLLSNPPVLCENIDDMEPLFEAIVVLEEFCKELAAVAFVKYHHATE